MPHKCEKGAPLPRLLHHTQFPLPLNSSTTKRTITRQQQYVSLATYRIRPPRNEHHLHTAWRIRVTFADERLPNSSHYAQQSSKAHLGNRIRTLTRKSVAISSRRPATRNTASASDAINACSIRLSVSAMCWSLRNSRTIYKITQNFAVGNLRSKSKGIA